MASSFKLVPAEVVSILIYRAENSCCRAELQIFTSPGRRRTVVNEVYCRPSEEYERVKEPEAAEIRDILMERAAVGDVKRAAAFYKIIRYSYGSGCTSYGCQPFDIRKTFTIIWEANRRLKDTVIENKDFEALIRQYDRPNAFFYCDPPYFETEGHYEVVFRKEDHVRLRDTLKGIQGKFMVSYNDCAYIRELYQDFQIEAVTRINNLAQRYDNGSEFPEVLIANYDMEERKKSMPMQMNLFELYGEQKTIRWKGKETEEASQDT